MIREVNGWEEDDDAWTEIEDDSDEMVLACGVDGCLMPGGHFRSECHTAQDLLRQERSGNRCTDGGWIEDRRPGGMECDDCGCIFISDEHRPRCKVCDGLTPTVPADRGAQ